MYSQEKTNKIGNTIVYLCSAFDYVSKTKLLKLLYLLDEISIKRSGLPFLNLNYKVWKFGPVASDIFVELSSSPSMLKGFVKRELREDGGVYISSIVDFEDEEFTQNELDLLDFVVDKFKDTTASELIAITHRRNSPWYNAAKKHSVLDYLNNEAISSTDYIIDMKELVEFDDRKRSIYEDYLQYSS